MHTTELLDTLRSRVSEMWPAGDGDPVEVGDHVALLAADEIERLSAKVFFWRTLSLVLVVAIMAIAATANAQGAPKPQHPPREWSVIPLNNVPSTCTKIGDKTVCKSGERVQTCWPIGATLYCKEGY